jgi:hypothetical protein
MMLPRKQDHKLGRKLVQRPRADAAKTGVNHPAAGGGVAEEAEAGETKKWLGMCHALRRARR